MYSLNLSNFIWSKVNTIGKGPTSRGFFSFALYNDDRIFMFGGIENSNNKILNETYMFSLSIAMYSDIQRTFIGVPLSQPGRCRRLGIIMQRAW